VVSHYSQLLALAHEQIKAAERGDVMTAIGMLDARQNLIASAPPPAPHEARIIQEVLELDRKLSGFIRERMIAVRQESLTLQRGQVAMRGYRPLRDRPGLRFDYAR
jgi:hypothetical protein